MDKDKLNIFDYCRRDDLNKVKEIIPENYEGNSCLHLACVYGNINIVEHLIKIGLDVNFQNNNGCTPLHYASSNGHLEIVQLLLKKGASRTIKNVYGKTALEAAHYFEHSKIVALLENLKVD